MRKHRSRHRPTVAALATGLLLFGLPVLPAVAAAGHDVLPGPPKPTRRRLLREVGSTLRREG